MCRAPSIGQRASGARVGGHWMNPVNYLWSVHLRRLLAVASPVAVIVQRFRVTWLSACSARVPSIETPLIIAQSARRTRFKWTFSDYCSAMSRRSPYIFFFHGRRDSRFVPRSLPSELDWILGNLYGRLCSQQSGTTWHAIRGAWRVIVKSSIRLRSYIYISVAIFLTATPLTAKFAKRSKLLRWVVNASIGNRLGVHEENNEFEISACKMINRGTLTTWHDKQSSPFRAGSCWNWALLYDSPCRSLLPKEVYQSFLVVYN